MKKIFHFSLAAMAGLVLAGCTGDYDDWAQPQTYAQEDPAAAYGVSAQGSGTITMPAADEQVSVITFASTNDNVKGYNVRKLTINGSEFSATVEGNNVMVSADALEDSLYALSGSRAQRTYDLDMHITYGAILANGDAIAGESNGTAQFTTRPTPAIDAKGYYLLGNFQENGAGWDLSAPVWMTSEGNGIYTAVVNTTADGDNWFKFYEGSHYSADNWDEVNQGEMGCRENGSAATQDFIIWKGDKYAVQTPVINGMGMFKVTLDMNNMTYTVVRQEYKLYIIGGPNDWTASATERMLQFSQPDPEVPYYTINFRAAAEGDTWFAIGDDQSCDAIAAGDWTKLFGTTAGNGNSGESGTFTRRSNLSDDGSFCVKQGAKLIKVEVDLRGYTYKVSTLDIADDYYLIGAPGEWNAESAMTMHFQHSDKSVFDDPVFYYVMEGTGSDMWFAFGDKDAIDAVAAGTWNQLFGTRGASEDLSGSFDRRFNLDGDHSFHVDGTAKYYRFEVNMMDYTYTITPLDYNQYVYFIGATDGWANAEQKLESPNCDGRYTGFVYCADPNGWGNQFKFQRVAGSWDNEINSATFTGGITGDFGLADGSTNIAATAGEGVYYVTLDLNNSTLNAVRITNMNLVGGFNGWNQADDAQRMTWNATDYCFEISNAGVTADGWKFAANNDWAINLGGDLTALTQDGANISAVGKTIRLYPTRRTSGSIYATVQ